MIYDEIYNEAIDIKEHFQTLSNLAKNKRVVEFGVRNGFSTFALLNGQPISLYSYDLNSCSRLEDLNKLASTLKIDFNFTIGDSREVIISEVDILFIDTLHTGKQLLQELELHSPKVKEKIIMHDTVTFGEVGEDGTVGLNMAIRNFLRNHPDWQEEIKYTNNNGLTILRRLKIALLTANYGDIDKHVKRDLSLAKGADVFIFNDKTLPFRDKAFTSRLHAKIPKMLGYQYYPGYDYYIWIDGNFHLKENTIINFVKSCIGYDICFFAHYNRPIIRDEFNLMECTPTNGYLRDRYLNEFFIEQKQLYYLNPEFPEQKCYACGAFVYSKSLFEKQEFNLLEQWFYQNCRYSIQDQLSLPYLLLKNKGIYNVGQLEGHLAEENKYVHYEAHS